MEEIIMILGVFIGAILAFVAGFILSIHDITRIIGVIVGALYFYTFSRMSIESLFIGAIHFGFGAFLFFAICFAFWELNNFLELLFGKPKPSPYSHAMGGLASLISSFFRR